MATVRTKFRASSSEAREGTLFYQVIHNRVARQIHTGYRVYPQEWDGPHAGISLPPDAGQSRHAYLSVLRTRIAEDTARLGYIISRLDRAGRAYTAEDVVRLYLTPSDTGGFMSFAWGLVRQLRQIGKNRTAERYTTVLNSFGRFLGESDVLPEEMDSDLMVRYETFLKARGICPNSSSYYMRGLRAVYNPGGREGADRAAQPVQTCLYRYRQDRQTRRTTENHPSDTGRRPDAHAGDGLRPRPVHLLLLHARHVIRGYGLPKKEGFAERGAGLPPAEDRAAAFHQVGEADAGDCREVRHLRHALPAADYPGYGEGRPQAVQERRASGQCQTEETR